MSTQTEADGLEESHASVTTLKSFFDLSDDDDERQESESWPSLTRQKIQLAWIWIGAIWNAIRTFLRGVWSKLRVRAQPQPDLSPRVTERPPIRHLGLAEEEMLPITTNPMFSFSSTNFEGLPQYYMRNEPSRVSLVSMIRPRTISTQSTRVSSYFDDESPNAYSSATSLQPSSSTTLSSISWNTAFSNFAYQPTPPSIRSSTSLSSLGGPVTNVSIFHGKFALLPLSYTSGGGSENNRACLVVTIGK